MNDPTAKAAASMRLRDLQLTADLLFEADKAERGARERVAAKYGVQKSVVTDRVARIESFFGVTLFGGPQRKTPTPAGRIMGRYGHRLIDEIEAFGEMLRAADADL